ncbi:hypothetical protein [Candidatus Uabimicrobium sp. HlEnr_7]|uniref:hypothetical protein n=1 Tax=Candidatus Uabimicrobium helgolandensis TaxID=3095367 RepID=UPI003558558B
MTNIYKIKSADHQTKENIGNEIVKLEERMDQIDKKFGPGLLIRLKEVEKEFGEFKRKKTFYELFKQKFKDTLVDKIVKMIVAGISALFGFLIAWLTNKS